MTRLLLYLTLLIALVTPASAQTMGLTAGVSVPVSDLGDGYAAGLSVGGYLPMALTRTVQPQLAISYSRLALDVDSDLIDGDGHMNLVTFGFAPKVSIPEGQARPFVRPEFGFMHAETSNISLGIREWNADMELEDMSADSWYAGITMGADVFAGPGLALMFEFGFMYGDTDGSSLKWIPVRAGMAWVL